MSVIFIESNDDTQKPTHTHTRTHTYTHTRFLRVNKTDGSQPMLLTGTHKSSEKKVTTIIDLAADGKRIGQYEGER